MQTLNKKKKNIPRGFTLMETLIAIVIFSLSLASLMTIASRGINSSENSKNSLTAQFFASEGIEFVRNYRDQSFLALEGSGTWTDIFGACLDSATPCAVDYVTPALPVCSTDECEIKLLSDGTYAQATALGTATIFTREIYITTIDANKEVVVRVEVDWSEKGSARNITAQENLLLWQ